MAATALLFPAESPAHGRGQETGEQEHKPILEEVDVVNAEVPVRVFYKKKPVKGLKKSDFKLLVNGKERQINGFYEERRKLDSGAAKAADSVEPRLFVLIFNIGTSNYFLQREIKTFFRQVIRRGDRLMVLTNTVYLKDRLVEDPLKEMDTVVKVLNLETRRISRVLSTIEFNLRYLASTFKFEFKLSEGRRRMGSDPIKAIRRFLRDYLEYFKQTRSLFLDPNEKQYLEVAEYLQRQTLKKWVLHFYQLPLYPQLKEGIKSIKEKIDEIARVDKTIMHTLLELNAQMNQPDSAHVRNVGDLFLNTGATFHTLLLPGIEPKNMEDFEYRPITVDSEHISRRITKLTHGSLVFSNKMDKFIKKITAREDVLYMLTYVPEKSSGKKKDRQKVDVTLPGKKYRKYKIIHDDKQRPAYFRQILKKTREEIPWIRIRKLDVAGGKIEVLLSGIRLLTAGDSSDKLGKIHLDVKILDSAGLVVSSARKAFTSKASEIPLNLRLPSIKKGDYQFLLAVEDIGSGRNDLKLKELKLTQDHTLPAGEAAFGFIRTAVQMSKPGTQQLIQPLDRTAFSTTGEVADQSKLPDILEHVARYCKRLQAIPLNFFCIEEIDEKVVNKVQQQGKLLKKRTLIRNNLTYGYRLIRDKNKIREERVLFKQNGWKRTLEHAPLKTRFKYKNIIYGPLIFNRKNQQFYNYRILGKQEWHGKNVLMVEAVPRAEGERRFVSGKFWVNEDDYNIIRIEIYQQSLQNFGEIDEMARKHNVEPRITIINEYDIVKRGIRFPSKVYYEEAFKNKKGRMIVQSRANITFSDYRFFTVESRVTQKKSLH
jgi:hypothetical protein